MPVRIYDIAKKLGIESKEVLVKAKELGIVHARVASSTLDKITAEYLEQHLPHKKAEEPPVPPAPAPAETPLPPAGPVEIKIVSETSAPPEIAPQPAAVVKPAVESPPIAQVEVTVAPGEPPPVTAEVLTPEAPLGAEPPAATTITVPEPPIAGPPITTEVPAVAAAIAAPPPAVTITPAESAITIKAEIPAIPPPPPKPAIGDKVGFIQLPTRPGGRVIDKTPPKPAAKPAPARPEAPRPERERAPAKTQVPAVRPVPGAPKTPAPGKSPMYAAPPGAMTITMKPPIIVRDLAEKLNRKPFQIIADMIDAGVFANVNQAVDEAVAIRICAKHGYRFELEKRGKPKPQVIGPKPIDLDPEDKPGDLKPRAPVVTIMGHVDHGKTTLLDVIRKSNVAAGEAGGITQHIGAYTISFPHPEDKKRVQQITFLDTPGHAAFSAMRARGATVTDMVVLVVAANDGVMPQTLEALSHAQAAKVPIIVAINKCDHPNANPVRVRQQLNDRGLAPDDWGGNTIYVECSALTKQGVDKLLEMILLQADLQELKANPNRHAKGNIIESGLDPGGPTATVLVRKGTLRIGEMVICGQYYGKVRALINEDGKRLKEAGPSYAVKVLGLNGVPDAGLEFSVLEDDKAAREEAEKRAQEVRSRSQETRQAMTLDALMTKLNTANEKIMKAVVKADTQGSVEAIVEALKKIESDKVSLEIIHSAVGIITESDVLLAAASKAVILGFHTRVDSEASEVAKREGVQIKLYAIIYELIDEVKDAMAGLLEPVVKEMVIGAAEVRKVFLLSKGGNVAGCMVSQGRIARGKVRIMRRKNLIYEGVTQSLRRYQDEVAEVRAGMECGIRIDGFNEFQEGDVIECYIIEKIAQKL